MFETTKINFKFLEKNTYFNLKFIKTPPKSPKHSTRSSTNWKKINLTLFPAKNVIKHYLFLAFNAISLKLFPPISLGAVICRQVMKLPVAHRIPIYKIIIIINK